jgi:hypothetical protein
MRTSATCFGSSHAALSKPRYSRWQPPAGPMGTIQNPTPYQNFCRTSVSSRGQRGLLAHSWTPLTSRLTLSGLLKNTTRRRSRSTFEVAVSPTRGRLVVRDKCTAGQPSSARSPPVSTGVTHRLVAHATATAMDSRPIRSETKPDRRPHVNNTSCICRGSELQILVLCDVPLLGDIPCFGVCARSGKRV